MPTIPFKIKLKALPLNKKIALAGSIVAILGSLLPWYSDVDQFKSGDSFLGITGPLYLAGFIVLLASAISFGLILTELLEKPLPKIPISQAYINIFGSGLSVLMLILAASVYFHPKFGVNLTDKLWGIGLTFGFVGTGLVMLAGILTLRRREVSFEGTGKIEPLIDMNRQPSGIENRQELDKTMSVGDAMNMYGSNKKSPNGWGPVQESINNIREESKPE